MVTVEVRELRQSADALLDRVESSGVTIEITNHGRSIARLSPITPHTASNRTRLIEAGVLRPGRGNLLDIVAVPAPPGTPSTADLLDSDRGNR